MPAKPVQQEPEHCLDDPKAAHYLREQEREKRMLEMASGKIPHIREADEEADLLEEDELPASPKKKVRKKRTVPVEEEDEDGTVIRIENKAIPVELSFSCVDLKGREVVFGVTVLAYSVEVTQDSISLLMDGKTKLNPPKLSEMTLLVNGTRYKIAYAGASHTLGKLTNIAFVIVT